MSTPPRGIATVVKALAALLILTVVLVGVPVLLIVLGAYPHTLPTGSQALRTLTQRDTGPLLQAVLTLLVWLTWALFVLATIREGLAAVRSRGAAVASPFTGLSTVSVPAAYLVHTALALFIAGPVLLTATATATAADVTSPSPATATASTATATVTGVRPSETPTAPAPTAPATALVDQAPAGPTVTVRRHDTLWRLAELHLDDPRRWTEIRTLNQGLLHGGTTLLPGQQLRLPADARLTDTRATDTAVVERGDTIWQIAADHDVPAQAVIDANLGRQQPGGDHLNDPDHIEPGWTLVIPRGLQPPTPPADRDRAPHEQPPSASTPPSPPTAPTPSPGTAAQAAPGPGTPWTPAGGWPTGSGRDATRQTASPHVTSVPPSSPHPTAASRQVTGSAIAGVSAAAAAADGEVDVPGRSTPAQEEQEVPAWMVAGLSGAGGVLAAGVWIALDRRRRRQHRARRPGRVISISARRSTSAVERTARAVGAVTAATVEWLDEVLRRTAAAHAAAGRAVPRLAAVGLGEELLVRWVDPVDPVAPWTGTAEEWRLARAVPLDQVGPRLTDQPAPYPALVTTGTGLDGTVWLVNLEDQVTMLIGDRDAARDLGRYWAAEIACNTWSGQVRVDCVGLGNEVAAMNPDRVHAHPVTPAAHGGDTDPADPADPLTQAVAEAVATLNRTRQVRQDVVTARTSGAGDDAWPTRIVLLEDPADDSGVGDVAARPVVADLIATLASHPGRTAAAVVVCAGPSRSSGAGTGWLVELRTGRAYLTGPGGGIDLVPAALTAAEAQGCVALLAVADSAEDGEVAIPPADDSTAPPANDPEPAAVAGQTSWRTWAAVDGSVRVEHTRARATTPADPTHLPHLDGPRRVPDDGEPIPAQTPDPVAATTDAGVHAEISPPESSPALSAPEGESGGSVLPAPDAEYLAVAATTREDLAVLAPQVPAPVAAAISRVDPGLDADLAAWRSPDCPLPRLTLLGPVQARTRGRAVTKRKPYWTEVLAFLALRRHGATPAELADAFGLTNAKAREYVRIVRDWLGTNPRTGTLHLPHAQDAPSALTRGIGVYEVIDVLVDIDLFRRLRLRAQSRGADGIGDLVAALRLVQGRPFDRLRVGGWSWLTDGDRLDHHMVSAVVDVAHIVTAHALQVGDRGLARWATETAALAAPDEEIPKLDLAAIAQAESRPGLAASVLRAEVTDRCDSDDGAPDDLPARTSEILHETNWLAPPRQAS